jgi:hypothetical protein
MPVYRRRRTDHDARHMPSMSSHVCVGVSFGLGGVFVEEEGSVDDVGESAAEES